MSSHLKADMKGAFRALQVNQPLRLPKDGPGLKPPGNDAGGKEAPHHETPRNEGPRYEAPRSEATPSEATSTECARKEVPQAGVSGVSPSGHATPTRSLTQTEAPLFEASRNGAGQNEQPHNEAPPDKPPRCEPTRNEEAHPERAPVERARGGAPRFEEAGPPQKEVPRKEAASEWTAAFFKLSPAVFSEPRLRDVSGDCFRLFLWLSSRAWRYPDSTGVVRAAVSVIEEETGMGHATVSRALKRLKEDGLVTLLEMDFKRGNVWKISPLACGGRAPEPGAGPGRRRREPAQIELPQTGHPAPLKREGSSLEPSEPPPRFEEHLKNNKNSKKLSQEAIAPFLDRLRAIAAPKKREAEARHLDSLLDAYGPEALLAAVEYVETKGTLRGEKCHSPFSYLALAADDVMKRVVKSAPCPEAASVTSKPEDERESEERKALALARFEAELSPESRRRITDEYAGREFPHGFFPPSSVLKTMAALAWATGNRPAPTPFLRAV